VATIAAVVVIRRRGALDSAVMVAVVIAGGAFACRLAIESRDPATGLLAAAPTLIFAAAWRPRGRDSAWLIATLVFFGGAVAATVYPDGGSFQWGGRYLSPALGPLAAIAGSALAVHLGDRPATRRASTLTGVIVAVVVIQAVGAVVVPDRLRQLSEDGVARLVAQGPDVIIAGGTQLARLDWRGWPERCWIAIPEGGGDHATKEVLRVLASSGVERAAYAGVDPEHLRAAGAEVEADVSGRPIGVLTVPGAVAELDISSPYRCSGGAEP
jgi:hypothetical protein